MPLLPKKIVTCVIVFLVSSMVCLVAAEKIVWPISPIKAKKKNPVEYDASSIGQGKKLYSQWCMTCHGSGAKGDGPSAYAQTPHPPDLTDPSVWNEGDGGVYWRMTEGRESMPSFKTLITSKQRWEILIIYDR